MNGEVRDVGLAKRITAVEKAKELSEVALDLLEIELSGLRRVRDSSGHDPPEHLGEALVVINLVECPNHP